MTLLEHYLAAKREGGSSPIGIGQELEGDALPPLGTMVLSTNGTDRRALRNEMLVFALVFLIAGGLIGHYVTKRVMGNRQSAVGSGPTPQSRAERGTPLPQND